jgi:hypothetical protein
LDQEKSHFREVYSDLSSEIASPPDSTLLLPSHGAPPPAPAAAATSSCTLSQPVALISTEEWLTTVQLELKALETHAAAAAQVNAPSHPERCFCI